MQWLEMLESNNLGWTEHKVFTIFSLEDLKKQCTKVPISSSGIKKIVLVAILASMIYLRRGFLIVCVELVRLDLFIFSRFWLPNETFFF